MDSSVKYIVTADVESGGLPNKDKKAFWGVALCELALVVIDCKELKIIDEYNPIIAPYKDGLEYSPQAEKVHGLTVSHLTEHGEDAKDVYKTVKEYLKKYKNPRIGAILCGHNFQSFDVPFFEGLFEFNKDSLWEYVTFIEDTMKLGWYRSLSQENYKLGTCCSKEGIELVDAHRALTDTKANAKLMIQYLKYLRGDGVTTSVPPKKKESRFRETFQLV